MRAADIPEVIALKPLRELLPYSMLAKEWEWWFADREMMVADRPVGDTDDLCRIAAVVHALCDRDGTAVPDWVFDYRSPSPLALAASLVVDGQILQRSIDEAPPTCAYHNVWFSYRTLEPLKMAAKRIRAARKTANSR